MRSPARASQLPLFLLVALIVIVVVGGVGAIVAFEVSYTGRAFPGVHLQGTDLTGMRPEEIFRVAETKSSYFRSPGLTLKVADSATASSRIAATS